MSSLCSYLKICTVHSRGKKRQLGSLNMKIHIQNKWSQWTANGFTSSSGVSRAVTGLLLTMYCSDHGDNYCKGVVDRQAGSNMSYTLCLVLFIFTFIRKWRKILALSCLLGFTARRQQLVAVSGRCWWAQRDRGSMCLKSSLMVAGNGT